MAYWNDPREDNYSYDNAFQWNAAMSNLNGMPVRTYNEPSSVIKLTENPTPTPGPDWSNWDGLLFTAIDGPAKIGMFLRDNTPNGTGVAKTIEYSTDGANTWTAFTTNTEERYFVTLAKGQSVAIRGNNDAYGYFNAGSDYFTNRFIATGKISASGNCNSLLSGTPTNFTSANKHCFVLLFTNMLSLVDASNLLLPSTIGADNCYYGMFWTTSITVAPEVYITTASDGMCRYMFRECKNLIVPPTEISATASYSHRGMFYGCTSLEYLPKITATIISSNAFYQLAYNCSSLSLIETEMTDISASYCLYQWLYGVSNTGDFYCPSTLTIPIGISGIPSGWVRHNLPVEDWWGLKLTMPDGGNVILRKNGSPTAVDLEVSTDAVHWSAWELIGTDYTYALTAGQTLCIRNTSETATGFSTSASNYWNFVITDDCYAGGNVFSLSCKKEGVFLNDIRQIFHFLFLNCTGLITPPILPTNKSGVSCYNGMFDKCANLIEAPELLMTTPSNYSCNGMFRDCHNINKIVTHMTNIKATNCLFEWLKNVATSGDFYCPTELTIPVGVSGIPSGWTRHDLPTE